MIILTVFLQNNKNITEKITARSFIFCFYHIKQIKIERVMNFQSCTPREVQFVWCTSRGVQYSGGDIHTPTIHNTHDPIKLFNNK